MQGFWGSKKGCIWLANRQKSQTLTGTFIDYI
jgi:hypothetical protein